MEIATDQIWKDNDTTMGVRLVRVIEIDQDAGRVKIQRCNKDGSPFLSRVPYGAKARPIAPAVSTYLDRFGKNGRTGFTFVSVAPGPMAQPVATPITVGQVYRDNDPRLVRFVKVAKIAGQRVETITCDADGVPIGMKRHAVSDAKRFGTLNRGGFSLHRDVQTSAPAAAEPVGQDETPQRKARP